MLDFTVEIAKAYNVTPFEIFKQDKDEVIMLINYLVEKSKTSKPIGTGEILKTEKYNNQRIRVDDSTATGGWW